MTGALAPCEPTPFLCPLTVPKKAENFESFMLGSGALATILT